VAATAIDQEWLAGLCRAADQIIWDAFRFASDESATPWPRLVLPAKGKERRLGEQEARMALVAALLADPEAGSWALAAEAPTRLSYRLAGRASGARAQRALVDLALYRGDADAPALAVEFTSGGRSGKSEHDDSIRRDVAKVLAEQPPVLWFQVVRDATGSALEGLLRALDAAISLLSNPYKLAGYLAPGKAPEPRAKAIAFHLCIVNPGLMASLHRVLDYVPGRPDDSFFSLAAPEADGPAAGGPVPDGVTVSSGRVAGDRAAANETVASAIELAARRGWRVHRPAG